MVPIGTNVGGETLHTIIDVKESSFSSILTIRELSSVKFCFIAVILEPGGEICEVHKGRHSGSLSPQLTYWWMRLRVEMMMVRKRASCKQLIAGSDLEGRGTLYQSIFRVTLSRKFGCE
jgi:hypothetical protein